METIPADLKATLSAVSKVVSMDEKQVVKMVDMMAACWVSVTDSSWEWLMADDSVMRMVDGLVVMMAVLRDLSMASL
jgi:hypothetical protein